MRNLLLFLIIISIPACQVSRTVEQGFRGQVLWFEGDLMPGFDRDPVEGTPVKREIYCYAPTHLSQAEEVGHVFYRNIETKLIKVISSDENGEFSVKLDEGTYSVFVKEPEGLFANRYNEQGFINPVRVMENEVTKITLRVDYKAAY